MSSAENALSREVAGLLLVYGTAVAYTLIGIAIILNGSDGLQTSTSLGKTTEWAPAWVWGSIPLVGGVVVGFPNRWPRVIATGLICVWAAVWLSAITATLGEGGQPYAVVLYLWVIWVHIVIGVAGWKIRRLAKNA